MGCEQRKVGVTPHQHAEPLGRFSLTGDRRVRRAHGAELCHDVHLAQMLLHFRARRGRIPQRRLGTLEATATQSRQQLSMRVGFEFGDDVAIDLPAIRLEVVRFLPEDFPVLMLTQFDIPFTLCMGPLRRQEMEDTRLRGNRFLQGLVTRRPTQFIPRGYEHGLSHDFAPKPEGKFTRLLPGIGQIFRVQEQNRRFPLGRGLLGT